MDVGLDLIDLVEFEQRLKRCPNLLAQILNDSEINGHSQPTLAGKVAVKECLVKVGILKPGEWKSVAVLNGDSGKPYICDSFGTPMPNLKVSISHTNGFVSAVVFRTE